MDLTTLIMLLLAAALTVLSYLKLHHFPVEGFKSGGKLFWDVLPTLILAFIALACVAALGALGNAIANSPGFSIF